MKVNLPFLGFAAFAATVLILGPPAVAVEPPGQPPPTPADADRQASAEARLQQVLLTSTSDSLLEANYWTGRENRSVRLGRGDTLFRLLAREEVAAADAHAAALALAEVFDPRHLRAGQRITLDFQHRRGERRFAGLSLLPDPDSRIEVVRAGADGFQARELANRLETRRVAAGGLIETSLAAGAAAAGVPFDALQAVIHAYSYELDFQRDIQPGDRFALLYEEEHYADGRFARTGDILLARLTLSGLDLPIYRFETAAGTIDYFDPEGRSIRRALLRTPVDGARISSGYGMRRHPILGYSRMHQGIDFAAPTGTPIFAAGDGVVDRIGRNGGYGRYIRLRHHAGLATAYGHMSRFAPGLGRGDRVSQGDVIGYVGSTGLSTGPHLHYEVLVDGRATNPLTIDLPTGEELTGADLIAFRARVAELDRDYERLLSRRQIAEASAPRD